MSVTIFDGIIIGITLISALLALFRGFVREVFSIGSWVVAAIAAIYLYLPLLPTAEQYIPQPLVAQIAVIASVFLITLIIVSYISAKISDFILDSRAGPLDRTLGFVFGAFRGLLLCVVAMSFISWFVSDAQMPTWIANSKSKPWLEDMGDSLISMFPDKLEFDFLDRLRNTDEQPEPSPASAILKDASIRIPLREI
jgi:membrane protein required for colicin V production